MNYVGSHGSSKIVGSQGNVRVVSNDTLQAGPDGRVRRVSDHGDARLVSHHGDVRVLGQHGDVELVEIPSTSRSGCWIEIVVAGSILGVALIVPGGIVLYCSTATITATSGLLSATAALAAAYPVATTTVASALIGTGMSALLYPTTTSEQDVSWGELGKSLLVGAVVGAASAGVGMAIAAKTTAGQLLFANSRVVHQAIAHAAIASAGASVAASTAHNLTTWILSDADDFDVAAFFIDLGCNVVVSIAPIVGGGIAVRFNLSMLGTMAMAAGAGAAAAQVGSCDDGYERLFRTAMCTAVGAAQGYFIHKLAAFLEKDMLLVEDHTSVRYSPATDTQHEGFDIFVDDNSTGNHVHAHVQADHTHSTVWTDEAGKLRGGQVHVKHVNEDPLYLRANDARLQADYISQDPAFHQAARAVGEARAEQARPRLQQIRRGHIRRQFHTELRKVTDAINRGALRVVGNKTGVGHLLVGATVATREDL